MDRASIKDILVVCTGNSCRSVMAEAYLKKRLKEMGKDIHVHSAGTATFHGMPASIETVNVVKTIGVDVSGHEATPLTPKILKEADIVLVMEDHHKDMVLNIDPDKEDRVFFLREFQEKTLDENIPDPIGEGKKTYEEVFNIIKSSTEGFLKWLDEK